MTAFFLGISDLRERTQRSRSTIYAEIKRGIFPEPIKVGRASRWRADEIERVLNAYTSGADQDDLRVLCANIHDRRTRANF